MDTRMELRKSKGMEVLDTDMELRKAVRQAVADSNVYTVAQKLGMAHTTVDGWVSGRIAKISDASVWKIYRELRSYLAEEARTRLDERYARSNMLWSTELSGDIAEGYYCPVVSDAAAASVNTLYYPLAEYASEHAEEKQYFPSGRPGDFAIKVSGDSMLPWYPTGTMLLVRPNQRISNGTRVIAILEGGEVVFKVFAAKGDKFCLLSINDHDGKDYIFQANDQSKVRGLYKVVASFRDEDKLDQTMAQNGLHHRWEQKLEKL